MKTRKELERENKDQNKIIWVLVLGFFLMIGFYLVEFFQRQDCKSDLTECQNKIHVWTLKVRCDFHNVTTYSVEKSEYDSYDEYKLALDKFELDREYFIKKDWKTCEVLE